MEIFHTGKSLRQGKNCLYIGTAEIIACKIQLKVFKENLSFSSNKNNIYPYFHFCEVFLNVQNVPNTILFLLSLK